MKKKNDWNSLTLKDWEKIVTENTLRRTDWNLKEVALISILFSDLCSEISKYNKIKNDKKTDTYFKNLLKSKSEQNNIHISSLNHLSTYIKTPDQSDCSTAIQPNTQFGAC